MITGHKCRKCAVDLVVGDNWRESQAGKNTNKDGSLIYNKICTDCHNAEMREDGKVRGDKKRQRELNLQLGIMQVGDKVIDPSHPFYKPGKYKNFTEAAFSSLQNNAKCVKGEVYVINNPAWKNWYKIGRAVDAEDRCYVYQTSSPYRDYAVVASIEVAHGVMGEKIAHSLAEGLCKKNNKEWFYIEHLEKRGFQKFLELVKTIIEERVDGRISTNT